MLTARRQLKVKLQLAEHLLSTPLQVVDVGALWGLQPEIEPIAPHVQALGFDPDPEECAALNRRANEQGVSQRFLPYVVAGSDAEADFHVCRKAASSSLLEPNHEFHRLFPDAERVEVIRTERVKTRSLGAVLDEVGFAPEFLKLDAHGVESELLDSLRDHHWNTLSAVFTEVLLAPIFRGQGEFGDIHSRLREHGFELFSLRRFSARRKALDVSKYRSRGQLTFADALYLRTGDRVDADLAPRLAMIAALFDHYDYAAELLDDGSPAAKLVARLAARPSSPLRVVANRLVSAGRAGASVAGPARTPWSSKPLDEWL